MSRLQITLTRMREESADLTAPAIRPAQAFSIVKTQAMLPAENISGGFAERTVPRIVSSQQSAIVSTRERWKVSLVPLIDT